MSGVDLLWSLIEKGKAGKNIGKTTGLPKLDKIIGGIQPHRYYLVGAGSSVGKTSFIMYIIYHILRKEDPENPIYFWYASLEIGEDVLLAKLMSLYIAEEFGIYLTLNDILSFETPLNDFAYNCLKSAKKWINEIYDYITIFDRSLGANTLYNQTLEFAEKYGHFEEDDLGNKKTYIPNNPNQLMIGVLDHFALIRCTEGRTLKQEIDLMSSYMVTLKRKLPLSWFVLMQQNRESSSMDRRKADMLEPGLNDLRDTAGPSQDADCVLQLFYPFREKLSSYRGYKILGEDGMKGVLRSVIISKNRYGVANQVICLGFWGSVGWWKELPQPDEIKDFTFFLDERKNIPCKKIKEQVIEDKSFEKKEDKPIIYTF